MNKFIIASLRKSAGKTSIIVGLAKALGKSFGYMKPFGDRLLYRKKRLWDYDASLLTQIFNLEKNAEDITIGFEHAKVKYIYDDDSYKTKILEAAQAAGENKELLFVESGKNIMFGVSVHMDGLSITRYIDGKMIMVLSGNNDEIIDDLVFIKKYLDTTRVNLAGVIINKVIDVVDFKTTYMSTIESIGIPILGIIPYKKELNNFSVITLVDGLFARVIAGEDGLDNVVKNIIVGAMSTNEAWRTKVFHLENKLVITGGDRSDMILAALESDSAAVIITNNIIPPTNIIAKANEKNIPLLLVAEDTFTISKRIDEMEKLLRDSEQEKIEILEQLVKTYVDMSGF